MNLFIRAWRKLCRAAWQLENGLYLWVLRLLRRLPEPQPDTVPQPRKIIYLTFDDGPSLYTERLLEILTRYNVKATFFVTKTTRLEVLPKITAAGHSIGNHTANHNYRELYADEESFLRALVTMEQIILDRTGVRPVLFRFPGGSTSADRYAPHKGMSRRLTALVQERGYSYFDWNLDTRDALDVRTPGGVYRNVISGIRGRKETVVLQHDIRKYSVDAVERILVWGLRNGYTFLPLEADSPAVRHKIGN